MSTNTTRTNPGPSNPDLLAENKRLLEALREELTALRIWDAGDSIGDVYDGIAISIAKIETALAKAEGRTT